MHFFGCTSYVIQCIDWGIYHRPEPSIYSQKKPLGLAMSLSPHRLAGKIVEMVGALSNTGLRVSFCLLFRLSQRLRDAYFLQK